MPGEEEGKGELHNKEEALLHYDKDEKFSESSCIPSRFPRRDVSRARYARDEGLILFPGG